jgi:hypothetical protein
MYNLTSTSIMGSAGEGLRYRRGSVLRKTSAFRSFAQCRIAGSGLVLEPQLLVGDG